MDGKQVIKLQSSILITLGATSHSSSINYLVWEWLPFHLGYYLFALGVLQLLKIDSRKNDGMEAWCIVQASVLLWVAFWFFEPPREMLGKIGDIPPILVIHLFWWKSYGYCLVIFGSIQLMKIQGADSPKLSLPQALLLIFWGIGFFSWGTFVWEYLPPFDYYNYLLALGILEFLKTIDMDTDSISIGRTKTSYESQNSSETILNRRETLMFEPENKTTAIECPGCNAQMKVPKLGMLQMVTCDSCGLSGEIEI